MQEVDPKRIELFTKTLQGFLASLGTCEPRYDFADHRELYWCQVFVCGFATPHSQMEPWPENRLPAGNNSLNLFNCAAGRIRTYLPQVQYIYLLTRICL